MTSLIQIRHLPICNSQETTPDFWLNSGFFPPCPIWVSNNSVCIQDRAGFAGFQSSACSCLKLQKDLSQTAPKAGPVNCLLQWPQQWGCPQVHREHCRGAQYSSCLSSSCCPLHRSGHLVVQTMPGPASPISSWGLLPQSPALCRQHQARCASQGV